MKNTLIAQLVARFKSGAACAVALGISRQAFNAAMLRGHLSNAVALRAAALLSEPENPTPPVPCPAPNSLYYVN